MYSGSDDKRLKWDGCTNTESQSADVTMPEVDVLDSSLELEETQLVDESQTDVTSSEV